MSKKKVPEVRLLLDMEGLFDMDADLEDNQVIVKAVLAEKELTLTAWKMKGGEAGEEIADDGKDYASLGVVVLGKREHAALMRMAEVCYGITLEHLEGSQITGADIVDIHNRAAKLLGKEAW